MNNPFQKFFIRKDHDDNDMFHLLIIPNARSKPVLKYHVAAMHRDFLFDIFTEGDIIDTVSELDYGEDFEVKIDIREA